MGLSCCSRWMFNLNRSQLNSWYINSTVVQGVWFTCRGMWWGIARCFGSWAKQFQINPKDPLIYACIYEKVGDFSPTLLLQVEWDQLKKLSYLHLVEEIGDRSPRSPGEAGQGGANERACTTCAWMVWWFSASTLVGARLPFATLNLCILVLWQVCGKCVNSR